MSFTRYELPLALRHRATSRGWFSKGIRAGFNCCESGFYGLFEQAHVLLAKTLDTTSSLTMPGLTKGEANSGESDDLRLTNFCDRMAQVRPKGLVK